MTNILDTPGRRLQALRKAKGITQAALASIMGVKPAMISRLETDEVEPSIKTLEKLSSELECTIDWLRCMPWTKMDHWWPPSTSSGTDNHTAEGEEAAILIDGVPDDARQRCLAAVRGQIAAYIQRREENEKTLKELTAILEGMGIDRGKIERAIQTVLE